MGTRLSRSLSNSFARRRRRTKNTLVAAAAGAIALAAGVWLYRNRQAVRDLLKGVGNSGKTIKTETFSS